MLAKNFNKTLKRFNKKPFNGSVSLSVTNRNNNRWKKTVKQSNYGTGQADKPKEDEQDDQVNNFMASTGVPKPTLTDIVDDNLVYTKVDAERNKLKIENEKLIKLGVDQDQEIHHLRAQVNALNKGLKMMNLRTDILEAILGVGKDAGDSTGIGFNKEKLFKPKEDTKFLEECWVHLSKTENAAIDHQRTRSKVWYCHYYGKKCHIARYCYKLYGPRGIKYQPCKTQWVKKVNTVSQVAYASFKTSTESSWYFYSGCSKHMTGKKAYLTQICSLKGDHVTFGNGDKGKIIGKGKLNLDGFPHLTDVLLVEGLTANLISISQLCDDGMKVFFCQEGRKVNDSYEKMVMHGTRSADNCYMWSSVQALSIRRLGHTNYRNIQQIISTEAVRGIPPFDVKDQGCGECQIEKQTKSCHQKLQQYTWVEFLRKKSDTFEVVKKLILRVQNEKEKYVVRIRSDHGKEFENSKFGTNNTNYEIWRGRKPNVQYFHEFGSLCYILVDREPREKFNVKSDEDIFLGYSRHSRALCVFNKRTQVVIESINVNVLDSGVEMNEEHTNDGTPVNDSWPTDKEHVVDCKGTDDTCYDSRPIHPASQIQKNHPVDKIIGEVDQGVTTIRKELVDY
ncbi:hypothetical protein LIER_03512 [Lithospermum erythrorhizon]|uniref:GAG-pre-integrase domain-containing protein n=1 Tax=Lithospermum erythrorhizon TaxID=34254 RepID=A0AAV3NY32_LITER